MWRFDSLAKEFTFSPLVQEEQIKISELENKAMKAVSSVLALCSSFSILLPRMTMLYIFPTLSVSIQFNKQ